MWKLKRLKVVVDITIDVIHTSVFGLTPQGGNPCPVVLEADELSSEQMQQLAADFAVETVFILSPTLLNADIRLRFFVPLHEMEMCGHATVAAVRVLIDQNHMKTSPVKIETALGVIAVEWAFHQKSIQVSVEKFPPTFAENNPVGAEVASALRISGSAICTKLAPIQSVSTSRPKLVIPIQSQNVLDELEPNFDYLWSLCDQYQMTGFIHS